MDEFESESSRPSLTPARQRRLGRWLLMLLALAVGVVSLRVVTIQLEPPPRQTDYARHAAGPVDSRRVAWVGHSLIDSRDPHADDPRNVAEWVGSLAEGTEVDYEQTQHTRFGASLSLLWSGSALSFSREDPELALAREALVSELGDFDVLVMGEGVPLRSSLEPERTAYYATEFYCAITTRNPRARVYLYEGWSHLYASDQTLGYAPMDNYSFPAEQEVARPTWDRLADVVGTARVPSEDTFNRIRRALGGSIRSGCDPKAPVFIVPVASVMASFAHRLEEVGPGWSYRGEPMHIRQLFANPYAEWPDNWPREPAGDPDEVARILAGLPLVHPDEPLDDIHASELGSYFGALVSFATIFRMSPVGLEAPDGLTDSAARDLQTFVWNEVRADPRTGVWSTAP